MTPRRETAPAPRHAQARRNRRPALRPGGELLESRELLSAFGLDSSFNNVGTATIPIGNGAGNQAAAVAVQPGGGVVLAGSIQNSAGNSDFVVDRLTPSGTLDSSFGTNGQTTVGFDLGGGNNDHAESVAVGPDGKIVVAGYSDNAVPVGSTATSSVFSIARLNSDGSIDTTFGKAGRVTIAFAGNQSQSAQYVTVTAAGQILVIGSGTASAAGSGSNLDMARLNADGTFDTTFGTNGLVTQASPPTTVGGTGATYTAATVDATGRVLVGGGITEPFESPVIGLPTGPNSGTVAFVERFTATGTLDTAYGTGGVGQIDLVNPSLNPAGIGGATSIAAGADGSAVVDSTAAGQDEVVVGRLTPAGVQDAAFGTGGLATITFPNATAVGAGPIGVLPDGRIVVSAQVQNLNASQPYNALGVAYLFADGTTDVGFGNPGEPGTTTFQFGLPGETASPVGLAVMTDGRVVAAAQAETTVNGAVDFGVARFALNAPATLTSDQKYVRALYRTYFGRDASLAEINFHAGELGSIGRNGVSREIGTSLEAASALVGQYYLTYLGRKADPAGQATYAAMIAAGTPPLTIAADLIASPEYASHLTANTDANYVTSLYQVILGRQASPAEVNFYVGLLPALGRVGLAQTFFASNEYRGIAISQDYVTYLKRTSTPSPAEVNFYVNSGIPLQNIPIIFTSSDEFYANAASA